MASAISANSAGPLQQKTYPHIVLQHLLINLPCSSAHPTESTNADPTLKFRSPPSLGPVAPIAEQGDLHRALSLE